MPHGGDLGMWRAGVQVFDISGGQLQQLHQDRPHLEYHPGFTASNASTLTSTVTHGGLEAGWDRMGIGTTP